MVKMLQLSGVSY